MWRQCALPCGTLAPPGKYDWTCASFGPPASTAQIGNRSVQPFLHSSWLKVPILYNWRPFPPELPLQPFLHRWPQCVSILYNGSLFPVSKLPLPMGGSGPNLIHGSLGPPKSSTQTASRSVQLFLQGSLVWETDRLSDHATWWQQ